jgi:hypothetical protein
VPNTTVSISLGNALSTHVALINWDFLKLNFFSSMASLFVSSVRTAKTITIWWRQEELKTARLHVGLQQVTIANSVLIPYQNVPQQILIFLLAINLLPFLKDQERLPKTGL